MLKFPFLGETLSDSDLTYTFTCPSCAGNFSILLERIPPVQARFRCPHCKQPMDFPSRDEARVYARLQTQAAVPAAAAVGRETAARDFGSPFGSEEPESGSVASDATRFRVEKPGFEADVYDRRAIRNLIRTGEILESDRIQVDDGDAVPAGELPDLRSLFSLRKQARVKPPTCCRTHTDKVAFFKCRDTERPLCEDCAAERKFGGTTIRVCQHCGGTAAELVQS